MKFPSLIFLYISAIHQKSHTVVQHKAFISSLRHSIVSLVWNRSQQFRSPQRFHWFTAEDYSHYTPHTHTHITISLFDWGGLCFSEVMEDQCWLHGIIIWGIRLAYLSPIELSHECSGEGWLRIDNPSRSSCEFQEARRENGGKREWNSGEILTLNVAPKTIFIPNE